MSQRPCRESATPGRKFRRPRTPHIPYENYLRLHRQQHRQQRRRQYGARSMRLLSFKHWLLPGPLSRHPQFPKHFPSSLRPMCLLRTLRARQLARCAHAWSTHRHFLRFTSRGLTRPLLLCSLLRYHRHQSRVRRCRHRSPGERACARSLSLVARPLSWGCA